MATITAHALIGHAHPHHGGVNPTHRMYLSENDRPAWILLPETLGDTASASWDTKVTWIPTLDNMLEDALLMVALHILKDAELISVAHQSFRDVNADHVTLHENITSDDLERLYTTCRRVTHQYKLALTVLEGSTISRQVRVLEKYPMDVEVCTVRYARSYSEWTRSTNVQVSLD